MFPTSFASSSYVYTAAFKNPGFMVMQLDVNTLAPLKGAHYSAPNASGYHLSLQKIFASDASAEVLFSFSVNSPLYTPVIVKVYLPFLY